jgi:hypothetical protein
MLQVTLPRGGRRAEVRSFCVVCAALLLTAMTLTAGFSPLSAIAAGIVVALTIAGVWFHGVLLLPYRLWNRLAKEYAAYSSTYVTSLCFLIIACVSRVAGNRGPFAETVRSRSAWVPRPTMSSSAYRSQYAEATGIPTQASATRIFTSWCWNTNNTWALVLLPFLILLSALHTDDQGRRLSDIYTLF